jgi:glycosyltransferase involved in cell wall biosynthesis
MPVRVHQLIAAAAPGDAVTGQALAWREALRGWGADGRVIAEHVHPDLDGVVERLGSRAGDLDDAGALVLHYSVWSRAVEVALASDAPLGVCYHNVTPGSLIRAYNPGLAHDCDRARAELPRLRGRTRALVADSSFNALELREAGVGDARVVPLVLDLPATAAPVRPAGSPPAILSVGRIVPNKRLDDAVRAFALYRAHRAPGATLTLVGSDGGFEGYRRALENLVAAIGVGGVRFAGRVSEAERDRLYARADAYLCTSEHEGFCAPLVEALSRGVPVVARRAGAVPETLGGAGLVLDGPDLLPLAAEALHEVVSDPRTRAGLAAAAARRHAELRPAAIVPRLRAALAPLIEAA